MDPPPPGPTRPPPFPSRVFKNIPFPLEFSDFQMGFPVLAPPGGGALECLRRSLSNFRIFSDGFSSPRGGGGPLECLRLPPTMGGGRHA